jgi:hypothetical protein
MEIEIEIFYVKNSAQKDVTGWKFNSECVEWKVFYYREDHVLYSSVVLYFHQCFQGTFFIIC